jgi:hypothetical protein
VTAVVPLENASCSLVKVEHQENFQLVVKIHVVIRIDNFHIVVTIRVKRLDNSFGKHGGNVLLMMMMMATQ